MEEGRRAGGSSTGNGKFQFRTDIYHFHSQPMDQSYSTAHMASANNKGNRNSYGQHWKFLFLFLFSFQAKLWKYVH